MLKNAIKNPKSIQSGVDKLGRPFQILNSFIKTNRYPKQLEELEDTFIDFIPQINIHGEFNSRIKYVSKEFDRDYTKAVDNTTEYIYFSDPQSKYWGLFLINSNKKFEEKHYYEY